MMQIGNTSSDSEQQATQSDETLKLIYTAKNNEKNLIKQNILQDIHEIEQDIFNIDSYEDYCQQVYS